MLTTMIATLTGIATVIGILATIHNHLSKMWNERRETITIVGFPPGVHADGLLPGVPRFTSVRKAISSRERVCVLITKHVSQALRVCDFVLVEDGCDPKLLIKGTDLATTRLSAICGAKG